MSIKDYTKYAKTGEQVEPVSEETVESIFVTGTIIEPIPETEVTPEPIVEPEVISEPEPEIIEVTPKVGHVFGCVKLNVRSAPNAEADVICTIPCNTEVEIFEEESEGNFYKIYTASGIEGFCMKSYILEK